MAYSNNHEYHPQFLSPAVVDRRRPNSSQMSVVTYSSSASQIGRLRSYLVEHDLHSNQQTVDGEMLAPEIIRDPFAYIPWFNDFLKEKSQVICGGQMENLSDLLEKVRGWYLRTSRDVVDFDIQAQSILDILNYIHTQKHIIVESMVGKPVLVHYLSMLSILLSKYLSLNIQIARPLGKRDPYMYTDNDGRVVPEAPEEFQTRRRMYWDRARSWMSCIAFQNDFSVDRICDTLLNEVLGVAPPDILGELIIGLIEQCIVRYHSVGSGWIKDKELTFFPFVRTMLVFRRFIRWYMNSVEKQGYTREMSNDLTNKCIRKRIDFCNRHIVPPRHLKESLQIITDKFPDEWFQSPPYESRTIMNQMLEEDYSTSKVFGVLTPRLCDIHILRLLGRLPRDINPQFPYLAPQSAEPRKWSRRNLVEPKEAKLSPKEEERITVYNLSLLGPCCVPLAGENPPHSVQSSVDSDSSHKISSTTAVDVTETNMLYPGGKEMAEVIPNLSNANMHLTAMNMDQCVVIFPTTDNKYFAPVCVMDSPPVRLGGKKAGVNMKRGVGVVRHNQSVSELSDTDEEGGVGAGGRHHILGGVGSKSSPVDHRVIVENKVVQGGGGGRSMKTRGGGKGAALVVSNSEKQQGGKRKGSDRTGEVGPTDTKQRRTSTSLPTSTPTKSVIVRADSCKVPHGGPGGEGAGPLLGTEEMEIGYPFMDPVWDSNFFDSGQDALVPLTAVEGNGNQEPGRAEQVLGVGEFTNHHEHSNPPGSGSPLFQHEADTRTGGGSAHVGGPLLNNTQPEVTTSPSLPHAPQTKAAPGPGVGKRLDNHTYYPSYMDSDQDLLCDDYLRQIDTSFSNQKKLDEYQDMSDDGKSTRSGKAGDNHKTSRRGRKPAGGAAAAQNHVPPPTPTPPPSIPRSTRRSNQRPPSHATDSSAASSPTHPVHPPPLPIKSSRDWVKQVRNNHQGVTPTELMTKLREVVQTANQNHQSQSTNQKPNQPISSEQQQTLSSVGPNPKKKRVGRPPSKKTQAAAALAAANIKMQAEQLLTLPRREDKKPGPGRRRKKQLDEATPVDTKIRNNEIIEHLQRKLTSPEPNEDNRSRRKVSEDENGKQSVLPAPNLQILASVVDEVNLKAKRQ
uniref:Uncharacterized protein n=2 Tax=Cacopsylla melanoneura TaxID=428564 RepID=A0A8D8UV00_9HEMI